MTRLLLALCPVLLTACIDAAELDRAVPGWVDDAPYPELVNLDGVQAGLGSPQDEAEALERQLAARANRVKRRAGALAAAPQAD